MADACYQSRHRRAQWDFATSTATPFRRQKIYGCRGRRRTGGSLLQGTTQTQEEANKIWDAIKTIPEWKNEVVATSRRPAAARAQVLARRLHGEGGRHVEQHRKEHLGDANAYMDIFNANKDQLKDPDKIKPVRC